MEDMTESPPEIKALKEALTPFFSTLPQTINPSDIEFCFSSFRYLAEPIVAIGLRRVLNFLTDHSDAQLSATNVTPECSIIHARTSDTAGISDTYLINVDTQTWSLTSAPRNTQKTDTQNGIRLINLHRIDEDNHPISLAHSTVIPRENRATAELGFCRADTFSEFMNFMDNIRPAMNNYLGTVAPLIPDDITQLPLSAFATIDQHKLVDLDGGLPGTLCRKALHTVFECGSQKICEYTASILPSVIKEATRRDIVWGKSFLEYNDLDDNVFAIPSEKQGRIALFHRNISLIFDHNAFIAWVDLDEDGELKELGAAAIQHDANEIRRAVSAISIGDTPDGFPLLQYRPTEGKLDFEDFFATGLMTSLAHDVTYDHKQIVQGNMDDSDDSEVITTFSNIFLKEDNVNDEETHLSP